MIDLSSAEIATFHAQGFVALNRITSDDEVGRLRAIFDRLFEKRTGWEKGAFLDLAGTDKPARPAVLPQILNPQQFAPELPQTEFRKAALRIAQQLLGLEAHAWFEHAIVKPAEFGAATPWHQDEAHRSDRELDYEQISVWVPLQDAVAENGCMQYIPATHKGPVLTHHSPSDDPRVNALECIGPFDVSRAVACPLPAGGVAIHHCRTIHGAGSNHSRNPRRAYILAFRGSARPSADATPFPWLAEKRTAAAQRNEAWKRRGGHPAIALRRIVAAYAQFRRRLVGWIRRKASL